LEKAATELDAVFVFIPGAENDLIDDAAKAVFAKARKDLERNKANLGLFTLRHDSPDCAEIGKQVKLPIVLVSRKGGGATTVPGDKITETALLQAYMLAAPGDGCCPATAVSCCP
jgi:hypothetical protein